MRISKCGKFSLACLPSFCKFFTESLHEIVEELKSLAVAYCIPYMFGFTRKKLGKMAYKKIGVSCLGILDYSGADVSTKFNLKIVRFDFSFTNSLVFRNISRTVWKV